MSFFTTSTLQRKPLVNSVSRRPIRLLFLWLSFLDIWVAAKFHPPEGFTSSDRKIPRFKTKPRFNQEQFSIVQQVEDRSLLSPGYIFIDPIYSGEGWGPQIYDIDGTLIWHGEHRNRSQNLHVCDFRGATGSHLCTSNRAGKGVFPDAVELPKGVKKIKSTYPANEVLDNTYRSVARYRKGFDKLPFNIHAFQMAKGGNSFVTLVAKPHTMDLRPYGGTKVGWVRNQCIDEIDTKTKKSIFHWCYLESGLKVWETQVFPFHSDKSTSNTSFPKAGSGRSPDHSWDFLHMNAVDKNEEGDFYISIRYLDQIVKVAGRNSPNGKSGTVLWRLGGRSSSLKFKGFRSNKKPFTRPHDVRAISVSPESKEEVITLFNNAWDGESKASSDYSEGLVIRINTASSTATLVKSYPHPQWGHSTAQGRGSVQILPNGNVMVGWGALPHITEFSSNGTVLYHATFAQTNQQNPEFSYRAFKFPWVGKPHKRPNILPYSENCKDPSITAYVSWNGATEVTHWRFSTAKGPNGPWIPSGTYRKTGFETMARLPPSYVPGFMPYVQVEALDAQRNVLSIAKKKTFVPVLRKRKKCSQEGCEPGFVYKLKYSRAPQCTGEDPFPYLILFLSVLFIEAVIEASRQFIISNIDKDNPENDMEGEESRRLTTALSTEEDWEKKITLS